MKREKSVLFAPGDINAFFGLMLDNMSGHSPRPGAASDKKRP